MAVTESTLFALDRATFKGITMTTNIKKRQQCVEFLKAVPIMASLTIAELNVIGDSLHEIT